MSKLKPVLIGLGVIVLLFVLFRGKYAASQWFYQQAMNDVQDGKDPTNDLASAIYWINEDANALDQMQQRFEGKAEDLMSSGNYKGAASFIGAAIPVEEHVWGKGNQLCKRLYIKEIICDVNAGNYDHAGIALQESLTDPSDDDTKNHPNDAMYRHEDPIYKAKRVLLTGELMEDKGENDRAEKLYHMALDAATVAQNIDRSDTEKRNALWILARAQGDLGKLLKDRVSGAFAASVADSVDADKLLGAARETATAAAQMKLQDPAAGLPGMDELNTDLGTNYKTDKERVEKVLGTTFD